MKTTMKSGMDKRVSVSNYGSEIIIEILYDVEGEKYVAHVNADEILNAVKAQHALCRKQ